MCGLWGCHELQGLGGSCGTGGYDGHIVPTCLPNRPRPQEVYSAPDMAGLFDCVATCFFLDTAHNVLQYLAVISRALAPGGHWVHLGPLLYHWADAHTYLEVRAGGNGLGKGK